MNNTRRTFLAALLATIVAVGFACGPFYYEPLEYYTCHIPTKEAESARMEKLWTKLLPDVDQYEIKRLIFDDDELTPCRDASEYDDEAEGVAICGNQRAYTVDQIRNLEVSPKLKHHLTEDGGELLDYVVTMRQVNKLRREMADPWYFPYENDPETVELNRLADHCLGHLSSRYGDRYAVLAARALNTLCRYDDLENLAANHNFTDKTMADIFRPYYAGVLYNFERYDEALPIFIEAGDLESVTLCLRKLGQSADKLSSLVEISNNELNYDRLARELQGYIHGLEVSYYELDEPVGVEALISASHRGAEIPNSCRSLWQYAEVMGHLINGGNFAKADSVLSILERAKIDPELAKSVRALSFIVRSKTKPYDEKYLPWVASEATWLIKQSDPERKQFRGPEWSSNTAEDIAEYRNIHASIFYFSDMLHKAADVVVVPRMLLAGDTIAALQLLDIVDNANLSDSDILDANSFGNSSACFALECGADLITRAMNQTKRSATPLETLWRESGSIRIADRWNDLAGTALLSEGRYKEAAQYLAKVSPQFVQKRHQSLGSDNFSYNPNTAKTTCPNPFAKEFRGNSFAKDGDVRVTIDGYCKLWFANEMVRLKQASNNPKLSANERAEARLKYGIGMANSVYPCWFLTAYGMGSTLYPRQNESEKIATMSTNDLIHGFQSSDYGWYLASEGIDYQARTHSRLNDTRLRGIDQINQALAETTDRELAADYYRAVAHYRTIKQRYSDTQVAADLASHCDRWKDY